MKGGYTNWVYCAGMRCENCTRNLSCTNHTMTVILKGVGLYVPFWFCQLLKAINKSALSFVLNFNNVSEKYHQQGSYFCNATFWWTDPFIATYCQLHQNIMTIFRTRFRVLIVSIYLWPQRFFSFSLFRHRLVWCGAFLYDKQGRESTCFSGRSSREAHSRLRDEEQFTYQTSRLSATSYSWLHGLLL